MGGDQKLGRVLKDQKQDDEFLSSRSPGVLAGLDSDTPPEVTIWWGNNMFPLGLET